MLFKYLRFTSGSSTSYLPPSLLVSVSRSTCTPSFHRPRLQYRTINRSLSGIDPSGLSNCFKYTSNHHYSTKNSPQEIPSNDIQNKKKSPIGINFHPTEEQEREYMQGIHNFNNSNKTSKESDSEDSSIPKNNDTVESDPNSKNTTEHDVNKSTYQSSAQPSNEGNVGGKEPENHLETESEALEPETTFYQAPGNQQLQSQTGTHPESTFLDDLMADTKQVSIENSELSGSEAYELDDDRRDLDAVLQSDYDSRTYYFDTFKIYTGLRFSGFTEGQSDVVMRAIRDMLSARLEDCKEEGVPKSGMDNEAYLFEAACSELKTEVQKMRETQGADYMSNLGRLQRDVEIAQQELNEYMTTLKSSMDLDINDHKNATKEEESMVHLEIQELHNKIAIEIISDLKSEIEALRWQTTRRGLAAVIFVASAVLVGISNTKKDDGANAAKGQEKQKAKDNIEYAVPVLLPPAEDVSFDETIPVPLLGELVKDNHNKSNQRT